MTARCRRLLEASRTHTRRVAGWLTPLWVADRRNRRRLTARLELARESARWHRLRAEETVDMPELRAWCFDRGHPVRTTLRDLNGEPVVAYCRCGVARVEYARVPGGMVESRIEGI